MADKNKAGKSVLSQMKIAVVDDHELIREGIHTILPIMALLVLTNTVRLWNWCL